MCNASHDNPTINTGARAPSIGFQGYRQKLDELEVSKETSDRLVQEANVAFNLNTAIFEELDVVCGECTMV